MSGDDKPLLLLIDDNASARVTLAALLEDEGFCIDEASSFAAAAVRITSGPPAAAVLLDLRLGDGDGADLVGPIRARMPHVKVIVFTGERDSRLAELSIDAVVDKGCSFPEFMDVLKQQLAL